LISPFVAIKVNVDLVPVQRGRKRSRQAHRNVPAVAVDRGDIRVRERG
jgi:hypothetical protein